MKVTKDDRDGIIVLTLKGDFDHAVAPAFDAEIGKLLEDGSQRIVLNMRLVTFINSTALGSMIKARKRCRALDGDLVVSQPGACVREGFRLLGLDRLFIVFKDDEQALAALSGD